MTWRRNPAWNFAISLSVAVALFGAVPVSASLFGFLPSIFGSRTPTPVSMPPTVPTPAPPLASYMPPGQDAQSGQPPADTLQPLVGVLETQPKLDAHIQAPSAPSNFPTQAPAAPTPEPGKDNASAFPAVPTAPAVPATPPATAAPNEKCKDKYPKVVCDNYRTYGYCHSQRSRLAYYCERTCGHCSDECFNEDETCTQSQYPCDEAKSKIPASSCKALCGGCKLPELLPIRQVLPVIPPFGTSHFSAMAKKFAADMAAATTASTLPEMDEIDEHAGKPFGSQWPFFGHDGMINNGEWEIEVTEERRI